MCRKRTLIHPSYAGNVLHNIRDVNDPAHDVPSDADVYAAALRGAPLDGINIEQETREVGRLAEQLRDNNPGILIDRGTRSLGDWEYEEVFHEFIARRRDRPYADPCPESQDFVDGWFDHTMEDIEPETELGDNIPNDEKFLHLVRDHLPQRLDLDSLVCQMAIRKLLDTETFSDGKLEVWQPWMGSREACQFTSVPPGFARFKRYLPFLGAGGEGRLVWRYLPWGVPEYFQNAGGYADVIESTAEAEDTLVRLSIRIANWLAHFLIDEYAHGMVHVRQRTALTGSHVIHAVVEILGDDWFDLPFDDEGKLKDWKYQRALPLTLQRLAHTLAL